MAKHQFQLGNDFGKQNRPRESGGSLTDLLDADFDEWERLNQSDCEPIFIEQGLAENQEHSLADLLEVQEKPQS